MKQFRRQGGSTRLRRPRSQNKETSLERLFRLSLDKAGVQYIFNLPMGVVQPDFYLPRFKVVIEVDGLWWHSTKRQKVRDRQKDSWYNRHGLACFRFSEASVKRNPDACVYQLLTVLSRIDEHKDAALAHIEQLKRAIVYPPPSTEQLQAAAASASRQ